MRQHARFGWPILLSLFLILLAGCPGPDPPDPPPPPDSYQIVMFYQGDTLEELSRGQRTILGSLALRDELAAEEHELLGVFAVGLTGPDGLPAKWQPWWDAIEGDPLPRIALSPKGDGEIVDYALPDDEAALWILLKGGD